MDTLISNVTVVTMNEKMEVLFGAYIGVEGGKITYLAKTAPAEQPATIVDGTGMVAIPGLINCHTHLATTALRSYCDDLTAREALDAQLQKEDKMDSRSAKAAALLGIAECLRFGVTSVSDLYYYPAATEGQDGVDFLHHVNIVQTVQTVTAPAHIFEGARHIFLAVQVIGLVA